ncbi:DUF6415 family natural product biosynthesis protein [Streptomyces spiralis]|uniref:DUF6415 family natural product biosynthesis protein n=1 Tax=Streptomyces spiralis TaxID=66376 RepID=UPI00369DA465
MNGTSLETQGLPLAPVTVRAAAAWFIAQPTLPRHGTVKGFEADFRKVLDALIPRAEELAAALPTDDVTAKVALAGVRKARQRLDEPEAAGLHGEVERVKQIARSVIAMCNHYDSLSGVRTCLLCDKPIEDSDAWEHYQQAGLTGGPAQPGRVHVACARTVRRP